MDATPDKQASPLSVRLTEGEKAQLSVRAGDMGLSAYVRSRLFGARTSRPAQRQPSISSRDVAHVLALLGASEVLKSLRELGEAARIGALPVMPETEKQIGDACNAVIEMRAALIAALGLRRSE